ncbi:mechanosensitive ion channel family protein [bacterium]|nr:mechanosensitive ion channel family protein [bacterium]
MGAGEFTPLFQFFSRALRRTLVPLLYFGVFYLSVAGLVLPEPLERALRVVGLVLFTLLAVVFFQNLLEYFLTGYWLRGSSEADKRRSIAGLLPAVKVLLWGLGLVFLLDNLGFEITAVVTGLGIGGIALGLAAQAILGDLFSYYAILLDRPFEIGDFIIIGEFMGTVEHVGIKTTRIRSLSGEQLVFSNSDLTGSRLRNYKRMQRRRILFQIGVTYDATVEQLQAGVSAIRDIFASIPEATLDRVHFFRFGAYSLDYEVVYFVESAAYNVYMDVQQRVNLELKQRFEALGLCFAFPTQTLHVKP